MDCGGFLAAVCQAMISTSNGCWIGMIGLRPQPLCEKLCFLKKIGLHVTPLSQRIMFFPKMTTSMDNQCLGTTTMTMNQVKRNGNVFAVARLKYHYVISVVGTSGNPIGDKNLMIMRTDSISIMGVGRKSWRE